MLELGDETSLGKVLGAHWWFHFGKALCEVVMPEDFYKVGPPANRRLDGVGQRALERDWAAWLAEPSDDLMRRSQFNLFYDIGIYLFGRNSGQARDYAMYFVGRSQRVPPVVRGPDPQRYFRLPASD